MNEYAIEQFVECGYPRRPQWCLARPTGTDYSHTLEVLNALQHDNPTIEYRVVEVEPRHQWWHWA